MEGQATNGRRLIAAGKLGPGAATADDPVEAITGRWRDEALDLYVEECQRLRTELARWRSIAYLIAMRVDRGAAAAELSLRRLAEDVHGRGDVDRAAEYLEAAALVQDAMSTDEERDRGDLDRLRRVQSAGRSS